MTFIQLVARRAVFCYKKFVDAYILTGEANGNT